MRRPPYLPADGQPFSVINTTPIIDIMLVLSDHAHALAPTADAQGSGRSADRNLNR